MKIEDEEDAEYYQPEMEGARKWPLVVGALLIVVLASWSYVPAMVQKQIGVIREAPVEYDNLIAAAKLDAELIRNQARADAEAIRRAAAQDGVRDSEVRVQARLQETTEPLIRLILENAGKYGLRARRVGDFVNVDLK